MSAKEKAQGSRWVAYLLPTDPGNFVKTPDSMITGIQDSIKQIKKLGTKDEWSLSFPKLHPFPWTMCCRKPALCVGVCLCGPCVYANSVAELKGEGCEAVCCAHCLLNYIPCFNVAHTGYMYGKVREVKGYKGSACTDCLFACIPCLGLPFLAVMADAAGNYPCHGDTKMEQYANKKAHSLDKAEDFIDSNMGKATGFLSHAEKDGKNGISQAAKKVEHMAQPSHSMPPQKAEMERARNSEPIRIQDAQQALMTPSHSMPPGIVQSSQGHFSDNSNSNNTGADAKSVQIYQQAQVQAQVEGDDEPLVASSSAYGATSLSAAHSAPPPTAPAAHGRSTDLDEIPAAHSAPPAPSAGALIDSITNDSQSQSQSHNQNRNQSQHMMMVPASSSSSSSQNMLCTADGTTPGRGDV